MLYILHCKCSGKCSNIGEIYALVPEHKLNKQALIEQQHFMRD